MERRDLLKAMGVIGVASGLARRGEAETRPARVVKIDVHTHYYPESYFQKIRDTPSDFSFDKDPSGQTIIKLRGTRFFGITPPMTDPVKRLEEMDRVGIDVEVVSLSTPNVFFADAKTQPAVARMVNDAYAELVARHPKRFKGLASIPMDAPDEALKELRRAITELKMNGVILLSNIQGRPLTAPAYRPFFEEANRMKLCILIHPMIPVSPEPYAQYVLGPIVGFPADTTLCVARMCYEGLFRDFPDIRFIVAHLGGAVPYLMERMDSGFRDFAECRAKIDEPPSTYLKRLYYDTVTFSPHNLRLARDLVGHDRMLMGSDYPHKLGSIDRAVPSIEALEIPQSEKAAILGGNALRILNNVEA